MLIVSYELPNKNEIPRAIEHRYIVTRKEINQIIVLTSANPYHELQKHSMVVKHHKIRSVSNETIKYLEKRPYLMERINDNYLQVSRGNI